MYVFTLTFVQALLLAFSSKDLYLFLSYNSVDSSVVDGLKGPSGMKIPGTAYCVQ